MRYVLSMVAFCTLLTTGCSVTSIGTKSSGSTPTGNPAAYSKALSGVAHGGQQPIIGAGVYLFAVRTTGYGGASVSLLNSNTGNEDSNGLYYVKTDSIGNFDIGSNDYSCVSGQQTYLYSVGGNPQVGDSNNTAAGLLAVLGDCANFSSLPSFIIMNEATTVAAAYALAGFATDATHMSNSGTSQSILGTRNAVLSAANLVSIGSGAALTTTPAGNGTAPQTLVDTIANILAACVNSSGPGSSACTTLFDNAMNGSTPPSDTATAAINIAHNPGANVSTLWSLESSEAPFQPSQSASAPGDFTVHITYTGGGIASSGSTARLPDAIAIDAAGNVWASIPDGGTGGTGSIAEFGSDGHAISSSSGYSSASLDNPVDLAIDLSGNVWVAGGGGGGDNGELVEFDSSGSARASYTDPGMVNPSALAIDASDNVWVTSGYGGANSSGAVNEFSAGGTSLTPGGIIAGGISSPEGIALDASGHIWIANNSGNGGNGSLTELASDGTAISAPPGYTGGGIQYPTNLAIDRSGNVWVANYSNISEFNSSGVANSSSPFYDLSPLVVAVDGSNNIWNDSFGEVSLEELNSSGALLSSQNPPYYGYGANYVGHYVAIDLSGNIWVPGASGGLTEFVGLASPVIPPIVSNTKNGTFGTRP